MKVAVTGANGFIGKPLCRLLADSGYGVIPVIYQNTNKDDQNYIECDITCKDAVSEAVKNADAVIHLAAVSNPKECTDNFERAYLVNVQGTKNVINATKNKTLILASTSHVYGNLPEKRVYSESDPLLGKSPYAITKIIAEALCKCYSENFGYNINIIRFFNIYGEHQNPRYIIPQIINQALYEKQIKVRRQSLVRDFLYIDDAASAVIAVLEKRIHNKVYNIGSGIGTPISKIIEYISHKIGNIPVTDCNEYTSEPEVLIADPRNITSTGWKPKVSLEEGLERMFRFYSVRN